MTAQAEIYAGLDEMGGFIPYVFSVPDAGDRCRMMRESVMRYSAFLARHIDDRVVED